MIHYGTDVLEMCYEEEVGHRVLAWHPEEVARRRDDIVTKAVLQKPNTMENLLWKSDIISFQNRGSLHALFFFFGHKSPTKPFYACKGLSAGDVCDGTSRSLVLQCLPLFLGLEPTTA